MAIVRSFSLLLSIPFIALLATSCSSVPEVQAFPVSKMEWIKLQTESKKILTPKCGSCHTSTLKTAVPKAVAIFDFVDKNWAKKMTEEQIRHFMSRVTRGFSDYEKRVVRQFLAAELANRHNQGQLY